MKTPGSIISEQAYAQGKMLDHSEWHGLLPRGATPSDIDMLIANRKKMIFVEFSRNCDDWEQLNTGQCWLYEDIVRNGAGKVIAALLQHSVPTDRTVRTISDVERFQIMYLSPMSEIKTTRTFETEHGFCWRRFVEQWVIDATAAVQMLVKNEKGNA